MKEMVLSVDRKKLAEIKAQGIRKISTPDACPNTLVLNTVLAIPTEANIIRPAIGYRRATAGTARKNGVDRNVTKVGQT
jgi:hypothetical protein